jgi:hypothetical protein
MTAKQLMFDGGIYAQPEADALSKPFERVMTPALINGDDLGSLNDTPADYCERYRGLGLSG